MCAFWWGHQCHITVIFVSFYTIHILILLSVSINTIHFLILFHECVILHGIHNYCILRHLWVCLVTKHKFSFSPASFLSQTCHTTRIIILSASLNASCHTTHSVNLIFLSCECHTKQTLILVILSCFFWNYILPHKTHHHSFWPLNANL